MAGISDERIWTSADAERLWLAKLNLLRVTIEQTKTDDTYHSDVDISGFDYEELEEFLNRLKQAELERDIYYRALTMMDLQPGMRPIDALLQANKQIEAERKAAGEKT